MAILVKHNKVSTVPDDADTSLVRPSDWNADHTLSGFGTAAELNAGVANGVATLDSGGKVPQSQIPVMGDVSYQGTWNASTNTPTLTSSVGTKGYYYVVDVAGSTNLNGITDWKVGDWAIFNGSVWQKVDNTDAVTSVNGQTGAVVLTASSVGAVSSVGISSSAASLAITNSPITSSGNIGVNFSGLSSQYVRGDGALANFPTNQGGGSSVSYYLNGSVNQGTFGGNTYYEMSKTPIIGTGVDFNISANGYIAQFITDAGDPALLSIPAGNWNFELFFSASSGGGSPSFYLELYKYDGTNFTLIATDSANPENITNGTAIDLYTSALAVPQTTLAVTDRLAIRVYVTTSGRTITLHTQDNHLCQIITTFSTGLTALNGLTAQVQYLATGSSGSDFNISSATNTHTFNLPSASSSNRGLLTSSDWTTFNNKGTVSSVAATAGTGISISGSPITSSGTLTITNTAPDQTVSLTAGTGISVSGTYPSFTIANTGVTSVSGTTGRITSSGGATSAIDLASGIVTAGTTGSSTLIPVITVDTYGRVTSITTASNPQGTVTSVTGTSPIVSSGGATPAISIPQATGSVNGFLSSTDWTTFNSKGNGTVTSVAALTLGTTGTDLSSTVANGTTTPVITLNVPTASATNRGALSSADWTTFNNKANAFTYTTNYIPYGQGTTTPTQSANLTFNGTTLRATDITDASLTSGRVTYAGTGGNLVDSSSFTFDGTTQTAPIQRASNGIVTNNKTIGTSFTIPSTDNAMSAGPVTLSSGVTVTVSSGSRWVVL